MRANGVVILKVQPFVIWDVPKSESNTVDRAVSCPRNDCIFFTVMPSLRQAPSTDQKHWRGISLLYWAKVDRLEKSAALSFLGKMGHDFMVGFLNLDILQTNFGHGDENC
ncbi:hypothetical protein GB937_008345 [Aspergillus fischeri]|nr:hypothetical protein GB937_008345 [Aspergillus fischeri]